jgi:hypothetical protein
VEEVLPAMADKPVNTTVTEMRVMADSLGTEQCVDCAVLWSPMLAATSEGDRSNYTVGRSVMATIVDFEWEEHAACTNGVGRAETKDSNYMDGGRFPADRTIPGKGS